MLRRVGSVLWIAALIAVTIAAAAVAELQPPGRRPQPSGSAGMTGRLVAADNGEPVRHATVSLYGVPDSERDAGPDRAYVSRRVETDVSGRFAFTDLPTGSYIINVISVSGFVRLVRPNEARVTEPQAVDLTIQLERAGAIEGRIEDENGDAMPGAQVQAVRRVSVVGQVTLAPSGGAATTNDLGQFRLFDLPAGEYFVVATDMRQRIAVSAVQSGYADTYYPGSTSLRDAKTVAVSAGRISERVDFTMARCHLARLAVHPVDSGGRPLGPEAQLVLTRREVFYLTWFSRNTGRREDGSFVFVGVPPANYDLLVTSSSDMEEAAYENITIRDEDVSVKVQTNRGATVSGRIIVDGPVAGENATSPFPDVSISAYPPSGKLGPLYARVPLVEVQGTDRFQVTGLRGPMVLHADVPGGTLLSMRHAGKQIGGKTLDFVGTETLDDVVVSLTTNVAQVEVTVTGRSAADEPEPVRVILFPEDPALWHHGYLRYAKAVASHTSGRSPDTVDGAGPIIGHQIRLGRMPPGRYLLAAIHDIDVEYPIDARLFEALRPLATPTTLVAGQAVSASIRVARPVR